MVYTMLFKLFHVHDENEDMRTCELRVDIYHLLSPMTETNQVFLQCLLAVSIMNEAVRRKLKLKFRRKF